MRRGNNGLSFVLRLFINGNRQGMINIQLFASFEKLQVGKKFILYPFEDFYVMMSDSSLLKLNIKQSRGKEAI